jgi:hypothetical protein
MANFGLAGHLKLVKEYLTLLVVSGVHVLQEAPENGLTKFFVYP